MLQTNDVGIIFATLQAAYGHSWAQKADAIPVWQQALAGYEIGPVMVAVGKAITAYPDYPPSIGQLIAVLKAEKPHTGTYIEDMRPSGRMSRMEWIKNNG